MVTVERACELVLKDRQVSYITMVTDIQRGYVISSTENGEEREIFDNSSHLRFIDKKTGEMQGYLLPQNLTELSKGIKVDIPEQYQVPEQLKHLYEECKEE